MTKVHCTVIALFAWALARSEKVADTWLEDDSACTLQTQTRNSEATEIESDYVPNLIDQFLGAPLPSPNNNLTNENPLVFLHQARAGGMSLRKLMYNTSQNLGLKAHIPCSGQVACNNLHAEGTAAVYGGDYCWKDMHRNLRDKGAKQVSCLTTFREPIPRIMSCYSDRLVGTEHAAPACMADLSVEQLKGLLVEHGCINEPFRRFSECGDAAVTMSDPKAKRNAWQNTLTFLSQCVPIVLGRQVSLKVAANYFPQMAEAVWDLKSLAVNRNSHYLNQGECHVPETHMDAIKQLAEPEMALYEAAVKRMWQLTLNK